jgi:hypothetical protein
MLVVTGLCAAAFAFAQNALHYLELKEVGSTPAEIVLSPDYQTIIEFEEFAVDSASSGRADQITVEIDEQTIRLRANQDSVSTDLTVRAGGQTALFVLRSDPTTNAPRRYVVRNSPPPALTTLSNQGTQGKGNVASLSVGTNDLPPGVSFDLSAATTTSGDIAIQYSLMNQGENTIVNDPYRLNVVNNENKLRYTLSRIPPAGSANMIAKGQAEYGTMIIPTPPNGPITLVWVLVEQGPGGHYTVTRDITALLNGATAKATTQPTALTTETNPSVPTTPKNEAATATINTSAQPTTTQSAPETQTTQVSDVAANSTTQTDTSTQQTTVESAASQPAPSQPAPTENVAAQTAAQDSSAQQDTTPSSQTTTAPTPSGENLLNNAAFDDPSGMHWSSPFADGATGAVNFANGEYCLKVENGGANPWSRQLQQYGLWLEPGGAYTLSFEAHANQPRSVIAHVGKANQPTTSYGQETFNVTQEAQTFAVSFVMPETKESNGSVEFWAGGELAADAPFEMCFDNIILQGSSTASSDTQKASETQSDDAAPSNGEAQPAGETQADSSTASTKANTDVDTSTLVASTESVSAGQEVNSQSAESKTNLISNAYFDNASGAGWNSYFFEGASGKANVTDGEYCVTTEQPGTENWHVALLHPDLTLTGGQNYTLVFDAHATGNHNLVANINSTSEVWTAFSQQVFRINDETQRFLMTFTMPHSKEKEQRLEFWFGGPLASGGETPFTVCLDNISLQKGNTLDSTALARSDDNVLANASFDDSSGTGWNAFFADKAKGTGNVSNGRYCVSVQQGGVNQWDVMLHQANLSLRAGQTYTISFDAYSDRAQDIMAQVAQDGEPFDSFSYQTIKIHETKRTFATTFTMPRDESNAAIKLFFGGDLASEAPFSVCFDNISLREGGLEL